MKRSLHWFDFITINVYWVALSAVAQSMTPLVIPLLVQQFVGDEVKGSFYGTLRLWAMMTALLIQALMGMLSDRTSTRFGRRRPFILIGTIFQLALILLIGLSAQLDGMTGYWTLFGLVILLSVASNTSHGAQQGLIPDIVPPDQRGRVSAVKAILEVPLPLILISFTVAKLIGQGKMWEGILVIMAIVFLAMLVTMFVPEKANPPTPGRVNWEPFIRLVMMTAVFTVIILAMGWFVKFIGVFTTQISSTTQLLIVMGTIGLFAMLLAIGLGVWMSVRMGLGASIHRHRSFTWWIINRLAFLVGVNNLAGFTVYFLQARLGLVREAAAGPAAMLTMFVGIFILVCALPSGWLSDRFGRKLLVGIAGLIAAVGTLVALISPTLPMIYLGGCLIGSATGLFFTANWALGTDLAPKEEAGKFLGISNLAGAGAGAIGGYIGGPIADQITQQVPQIPGLGYVVLFAIYGILFLISVLALQGINLKSTEQEANKLSSTPVSLD
ncbi:MAG TPA: MFS transporter [Anaerolineaceae bacterium]|nr:MFS transporter [Anaerolineaceae bacterium]